MINSQISHYRLVRKLGAGTYGEVYEGVHAHDEELRVAIKIVSPALAQDARFVDALKRECRQLDKLDHPNIVRFRDLVVNDTQVAMVLELLAGQDLHDRLAGGPLPIDTAVSVLEAMLEGLAYAHARGILHRDIKPGNVYWCDDGRVKQMKRTYSDGTHAIELSALGLAEKLAAIVPPPRANTVIYSGVLAANAALRPEVIPRAPTSTDAEKAAREARKLKRRDGPQPSLRAQLALSWADLLQRVFRVDGWECPQCEKPVSLRTVVPPRARGGVVRRLVARRPVTARHAATLDGHARR